jgi:hypothetical protein
MSSLTMLEPVCFFRHVQVVVYFSLVANKGRERLILIEPRV